MFRFDDGCREDVEGSGDVCACCIVDYFQIKSRIKLS